MRVQMQESLRSSIQIENRAACIGDDGALGPDQNPNDNCGDDTTPLRYARMPGYAPAATFGLVETAVTLSRAAGARVHVGPIVTSGLFYDPDPSTFGTWKRTGHIGVEMEAAMMYTVAAVHGLEALAMMTVSDVLGDDDQPIVGVWGSCVGSFQGFGCRCHHSEHHNASC